MRRPQGVFKCQRCYVLYNGTTEESPARKLIIDYYCWAGTGDWVAKKVNLGETATADFINDLLLALMLDKKDINGEKGVGPWVADPATYFFGTRKKVTL